MFLLVTHFQTGKKRLINLDLVERIDPFQEAFARLTFRSQEVFDTSESFDSICQDILHSQPVPQYITGVNEFASHLYSLPQTFPPDFNAPPAKPFFPDEIHPDINNIPKRD